MGNRASKKSGGVGSGQGLSKVTQQARSVHSGGQIALHKNWIKWPGFNGPGAVHLSACQFFSLLVCLQVCQLSIISHLVTHGRTHSQRERIGPSQARSWPQVLILDSAEVHVEVVDGAASSWSYSFWIQLEQNKKTVRRMFNLTTESRQIWFSIGVCINKFMKIYRKAKLACKAARIDICRDYLNYASI